MLLELKEQGADPKALKNRPLLRQDCTKYKQLFNHCSAGRQANQTGLQALPTSEILMTLIGLGVDDVEEREICLRLIRAQDEVYMDHMRSKMEQASTSASAKKKQTT